MEEKNVNEEFIRLRVKEMYSYLLKKQKENPTLFSAFQPFHISCSLSDIPIKPFRNPRFMFEYLFYCLLCFIIHNFALQLK